MADGLRKTNVDAVKGFCESHADTYPDIDPLKANLSGKTVVITGASKGVGRATAIAFAQAGCSNIAISARSALSSLVEEMKKAASAAGRPEPNIIQSKVDVTSEDNVKAFVNEIGEKFGGSVDVLVNNAGVLEEWIPLADSKPSEWWGSYDVNIRGTYLCSKYLLPLVLKSQLKMILNIASVGAHMIAPGGSAYMSAKFAICRITEFMASDYVDQGLLALAVHPGAVPTELAFNMPDYMHQVLVDTPELPAHFMVWLARERPDWLQGRYIHVNWDVKELEAKKDEIVNGNKLKFRLVV